MSNISFQLDNLVYRTNGLKTDLALIKMLKGNEKGVVGVNGQKMENIKIAPIPITKELLDMTDFDSTNLITVFKTNSLYLYKCRSLKSAVAQIDYIHELQNLFLLIKKRPLDISKIIQKYK